MSVNPVNPVYVEIDSNNVSIFTHLIWYLHTNGLLQKNREFILDECRKVSSSPVVFMIPKDQVTIPYQDSEIIVNYTKTRKSNNNHMMEIRFDQLRFTSKHPTDGFQHLTSFLTMISDLVIPDTRSDEICKYIWDEENSYWTYNKNLKSRTLDTIYFPQKAKIVEALELFLHDKERQELYSKLGIPYKYVILLHGLPGTGKTSLIRALASHFHYNLSIVKSISKMDDNSLEMMVATLRKQTFLVFEDIDHLFDQSKMNVSYSGILNMLDGVSNYDKLIVFITTNRIQQLDHVFKRRMDMFIEFTYIQKGEILSMYKAFFPESNSEDADAFAARIRNKKLTVNMLEKYFMHCLQHKISPIDDLSYLNEYSHLTSEHAVNQLYN